MWILSPCFCLLLIFLKDCKSEDTCIDGGLQQNGSCDFSTDTCNYTLTGWKRITGPYRFFFTKLLPGAHSKGGYIVFDYSVSLIPDIKVVSPWLSAGRYNFSFWYVLENKNSLLNVSLQRNTSTKMLWKTSRTPPTQTWTSVTLDLDSGQEFQIVFRTENPLNTVGIDDIHFECKAYILTTTTKMTVTMKPPMTTITAAPVATIKQFTTTNTPTGTSPVTLKPLMATITATAMKPIITTTTGAPTTTSMVTISPTTTPTITIKPFITSATLAIRPQVTVKPFINTKLPTATPTISMKPLMTTGTPTTTPTVTIIPFITSTTSAITPKPLMTSAAETTRATYSSTNPIAMPKYVTSERTMIYITTKIPLRLEDAIHPGCSSSGWNISLDMPLLRKLYSEIVANNIYFGDNTCRGVVKGTKLLFQEGFRDCLTSERISNGVAVYNNALFYAIYDPVNPFIIRQYKWTFSVECDVSRNEVTSTHVHHDIDAHHSAVTGHYSTDMAFFRDSNFMNQISGNPIHVQVGDEVYVKVFTTVSDWSMKMRLHTCFTKPTDDSAESTKYYIIKDGCETDSNTHIISQSTHETRFVFQDFVYSTNKEGLNMYCNVTFCETKDYTPGCMQSCTSKQTQALVGK